MLIIFFDSKGIAYQELALAGQTIDSAYYCDALQRLRENSTRILATTELPVASRQRSILPFLFHHGNFVLKTT
jgi:hypothetical protein